MPVPIDLPSQITDTDDTEMQSATITLINHQADDLLAVSGPLPAGITASSYNAATGVLTLTGPATKAAFQTALSQIVFSNSSDIPDPSDRIINVVVNDGTDESNTATVTVHVVALDEAPVIWIPSAINFAGISGSGGDNIPLNTVKFTDIDSPGTVTVALTSSDSDADIDSVTRVAAAALRRAVTAPIQ